MAWFKLAVVLIFTALPMLAVIQTRTTPIGGVPKYTYKVVHTYPHDPSALTQGLVYHGGFLYEGTGLKGHSSLCKVRLETGEVVQHTELPPEFFGEGIAIIQDKIVQLTWQKSRRIMRVCM